MTLELTNQSTEAAKNGHCEHGSKRTGCDLLQKIFTPSSILSLLSCSRLDDQSTTIMS